MTEFDLIRRYFTCDTPGTLLGVGDDAALLKMNEGNVLAVSSDMQRRAGRRWRLPCLKSTQHGWKNSARAFSRWQNNMVWN
jgi:thiamine monophosphate kinase